MPTERPKTGGKSVFDRQIETILHFSQLKWCAIANNDLILIELFGYNSRVISEEGLAQWLPFTFFGRISYLVRRYLSL
jgi:hypothetical protein